MKRKRFIKLMIADGYSRNEARLCADCVVFKCRRVSENNALAKVIFDDGRRIDINRYSYAAEFDFRTNYTKNLVKMGELMRRAMEEALRLPPNDKIVRKVKLIRARSNSRISTLEIAARKCELNLEGVDY